MSSEMYFHEKSSSVKTGFGSIQKIIGRKVEGNSHVGSGEITVPTATVDKHVNIAFPAVASGLRSVVLVSSVDMTVEYNSDSAPTATIALKAGVPYSWDIHSYDANKQTAATTGLYLSNASGATGVFIADAVYDGTPA